MGQIIHADFKTQKRQADPIIIMPRQCGKTLQQAQEQNQAVEILDSGLDLMVTLLTGDEWDVLEEVRAIKERINAKTVPAKSILIAKDILRIMHQTIPTQPTGGAA